MKIRRNRKKRPIRVPILKKRHLLFLFLGGFAIFFPRFYHLSPEKVEFGYSRYIYPGLAETFSFFAGKIPWPYSLTEILGFLFILGFVIPMIFRFFFRMFRKPSSFFRLLLGGFFSVLSLIALCYFLFWISWGLNYYRQPLSENLEIAHPEKNISPGTLEGFFFEMADTAVIIRSKYPGEFRENTFSSPDPVIFRAMKQMFGKEPVAIAVPIPPRSKTFRTNEWMNAAGIRGVFVPVTMEPHINADLSLWERPVVIAHEMAHFIGFASETDANLAAWIACMTCDSDFIKYSGVMDILLQIRSRVQINTWREVEKKLSPRILVDIRGHDDRIRSERTRYEKWWRISRKIRDYYLKSQSQELGVKSYGAALPWFASWWDSQGKKHFSF